MLIDDASVEMPIINLIAFWIQLSISYNLFYSEEGKVREKENLVTTAQTWVVTYSNRHLVNLHLYTSDFS